jgi:O-antigen ligase
MLCTVLTGVAGVAAWMSGALPFLSAGLGASGLDRLEIARSTLAGIQNFWPVGSGLGSFPRVYPQFEDPAAVTETFVNHAHNDYLELLFETGLAGMLLLACFLYWWATRCIRAWSSSDGPVDARLWPRAASIVTGVLLAHSLVDYPLRTPALMVCFLFFCLVLDARSAGQERVPVRAA